MSKIYLHTISGRVVSPFDMAEKDIQIWDIAWGLHQTNRWLGQTPVIWSVLSHTGLMVVLAGQDLKRVLTPRELVLLLMHDASEAYLGDMPRTFKKLPQFAFYDEAHYRLGIALYKRFGIEVGVDDLTFIQRYDDQALHVEAYTFFPDWRGGEHFPAPSYEPGPYPNPMLGKPKEYVDFLREQAIQLQVPQIPQLFEFPVVLTSYLEAEPSYNEEVGLPKETVDPIEHLRV